VHWWWRLVFSRGLDHAAGVERWTNGARAVPRAVRDLDAIGLARTWLGSLSKAECGALEAALAREFPIANDVQRYVLEGASAPANADTSSHSPSDDRAKTPQPRARTLTEREATANELTPHMRLCRLCLDLALDPGCARESGYSERELQRTRIDSENARVEISSQPPAATAQHRARAVRRSVAALRADRTLVDVAPQITSRFDGESRTAPAARVALAAAVAAQAHPEHRSVTADSVDVAPQAAHEQVFVSARTADAGVNAETIAFDTAYGGLFFVLNAALHLGLYGDFTRPLQRGLACSPWRLLLVAGRAWAGRRFRRDPLAAWLARKSQTGRRTARHDRAVDRVLPYLRARLALALGVPDTRGVTRIVLELAARVDVAADRLDAHYALAELPLAIRLAGLDRDLGWIPAAGSDVRFHFR
jgi:hypothetical protein